MGNDLVTFNAKVTGIKINDDYVDVKLSDHCGWPLTCYLNTKGGNFKQLFDMLKINKTYRITRYGNEIANIDNVEKNHDVIIVDKFYELPFEDGKKMYKIHSGDWNFYIDNIDGIEKDKQYEITYSFDGYCNEYKILTIEPLISL